MTERVIDWLTESGLWLMAASPLLVRLIFSSAQPFGKKGSHICLGLGMAIGANRP